MPLFSLLLSGMKIQIFPPSLGHHPKSIFIHSKSMQQGHIKPKFVGCSLQLMRKFEFIYLLFYLFIIFPGVFVLPTSLLSRGKIVICDLHILE
jgi:hypothetical protein